MDNIKPTNWNERFNGLKFISETHRTAREQRRKFHNQGFYTTVTFYALIAAGKLTGKFTVSNENPVLFLSGLWAVLILVGTLSTFYLLGLHAQNTVNRKLAEAAESEIIDMLEIPSPSGAGNNIARTHYWEIGVIYIFGISVGLFWTFF